MKKLLIALGFALLSFQSWATITYKIRYNSTTDMYEVYFISTIDYPTVANIGPSQATLAFDASYNTGNIITTSISGGAWVAQDKVTGNTGTLNTRNVVGFQTSGAPIAGGVTSGTEYELFTFTFGALQNCSGTLRLFVNGTDPTDPNGAGGDFTSFLGIGGMDEISTNTDPTFYTCSAFLPISLLNFSASKKDNDAILNWQVSNQDESSAYFELQRGFTGTDFKSIGRVDVNLNSGPTASYTFNDADIVSAKPNGVVYYRLKMVDKDGHFTYSLIRNLKLTAKSFGVNLYPNPAKNFSNVSIELSKSSRLILSLSDAAGRTVQNLEFTGYKGLNQKRIDLSKLAAGSYMLKVNNGNEIQTISFIKE